MKEKSIDRYLDDLAAKSKYSSDEIIKKLRNQISTTNLHDRSDYNIGYRDALRDMIQEFK